MTLEDETGFVNLIIWKQIFDAHTVIAKTASLLGVTGTLQVEQGVAHILAASLWLPQVSLRPPPLPSRDFH